MTDHFSSREPTPQAWCNMIRRLRNLNHPSLARHTGAGGAVLLYIDSLMWPQKQGSLLVYELTVFFNWIYRICMTWHVCHDIWMTRMHNMQCIHVQFDMRMMRIMLECHVTCSTKHVGRLLRSNLDFHVNLLGEWPQSGAWIIARLL